MEAALEARSPVELHTLRWGHPGGKRVLLVHGVQAAANTWWRIADALAEAGSYVTAPDLRGHGATPSARRYGLQDFAGDLDALGSGWDLVVGHSLGATVLAHALAVDPRLARRAVLLEPVLNLPEDDFEAIVAGQLSELEHASPEAIQASHATWHPEDCRLKAVAAAACSPQVNEAVLRENRPWDYAHLLGQVRTPVLVLGGEPRQGGMLDPHLGRGIARANPVVEYEQVRGGHSPHRDDPTGVVAVLIRALEASPS